MAAVELTEEMVNQAAEFATVSARVNVQAMRYFWAGAAVGVACGFYLGYRWNKKKLRAEAFAESEAEVEKIRNLYMHRVDTPDTMADKPTIEEVVREKGYAIVEVAPEPLPRPTTPPVPVAEPRQKRTIQFPTEHEDTWDYDAEIAQRVPNRPYIIHQHEFHAQERVGFSQSALTYYAEDGILTDEDESVIDNVDTIVGRANLQKFGHGSDDIDVVFIRNEVLEIEYEVCRLARSYEQDVGGLEDDGQAPA
jgi:hypothetical protein